MQPGAYACWLLAEMGADITVLALHDGQSSSERDSGPAVSPLSADDIALHAGKRRLLLDSSQPETREIAIRLAHRVDGLVNSLPKRIADDLGVGEATTRAAQPRLVYAQASDNGPLGGNPNAFMSDIVAQAAGGLMWKTGLSDSPPAAAGAALGHHAAGAYLCAAVLGGLAQVENTGHGTRVDVSLSGAQIALQSWEISTESVLGRDSERAGLGHPEVSQSAIWGTFETADGWLVLGSVHTERFERLCALMELPDLHARHSDDASRAAGIPEITRTLDSRFREHGCAHWLNLFAEHDIMGARVEDYDGVLTNEQAWASGYLRTFSHPSHGPVPVVASPIQFDGVMESATPPHSEWEGLTVPLLQELGYDREGIATLMSRA